MTQFLRFGIVGAALFVLDAATFSALLWAGVPIMLSRCTAICLAIFASWLANRTWTFGEGRAAVPPTLREFVKFAASQALGAGVSVLVSLVVFSATAVSAVGPWVAVAAGTMAGLAVNFFSAKYFVFRRTK